MILQSEILNKYSIRLERRITFRPETPDELLHYFMQINQQISPVAHPGIDPDKQNFLPLKKGLRVVAQDQDTVTVSLPSMEDPEKMVNRKFPRFSVKLLNDDVVAITEAIRDDYLKENQIYPNEKDFSFAPDSLDLLV